MCMRRLSTWLILVGLAVVMSTATAKADGTGDPTGKMQVPVIGGTPTVYNEFSLAPFGETSPGCTFDGTTEDCILKNGSSSNWTWAQITAGAAIPCADITFTATQFSNPSVCTNDPTTGDPTIRLSGVNYSPSTTALIASVPLQLPTCDPGENPSCTVTNLQTFDLTNPLVAPNCDPGNGYFPGVLIGCDFEFILSPGPDDTGTWPLDTPFSVVAPEPSTLGMLLIGLVGLPFATRRRKSVISA